MYLYCYTIIEMGFLEFNNPFNCGALGLFDETAVYFVLLHHN